MIIQIKNKDTLHVDDFNFKCCIGKNGKSKNKVEGDKKTPVGFFAIENLYYRNDKVKKPSTKLKCIKMIMSKFLLYTQEDLKKMFDIMFKYNFYFPQDIYIYIY